MYYIVYILKSIYFKNYTIYYLIHNIYTIYIPKIDALSIWFEYLKQERDFSRKYKMSKQKSLQKPQVVHEQQQSEAPC